MYQELGIKTVALDLDPQGDLTSALVSEDYSLKTQGTILEAVEPLLVGDNGFPEPALHVIGEYLWLLPANLELGILEDRLAEAWFFSASEVPEDAREARRSLTSFYEIAHRAAVAQDAQIVLVDTGPSLGAINRAALVACDYLAIPFSSDPSALRGLGMLGYASRRWRSEWKELPPVGDSADSIIPAGNMEPLGYIILQQPQLAAMMERLPDLYHQFMEGLSSMYHLMVLGELEKSHIPSPDPYCLATLRQYPSLIALAQSARKPMFLLKPADGALGSLAEAVVDCYRDFKQLAIRIANACGIDIPS